MLKRIGTPTSAVPDGFTPHPKVLPQLPAASCDGAPRAGSTGRRRDHRLRHAAAHGRHPVRLAGQDSRRGTFVQRFAVDHRPTHRREWTPLAACPTTRPSSTSTTRCSASSPRWASSTATPWPGRRAGAVGGPVRRLRQRRPDGHRRVHRLRGDASGASSPACAAAAPRLRGAGPRPLLRRASSASCSRPPRTTVRLAHPPPRPTTSTCCDGRRSSPAQGRWSCSRRSRCCATSGPRVPGEDFTTGGFQPVIPTTWSTREGVDRVLLCTGKVYYDLARAGARSGICATPRSSDGAAVPPAGGRGGGGSRAYPNRGGRLGAGGAGQPGPVVVHGAQPAGAPARVAGVALVRVSRPASAAPAVGSPRVHEVEQDALIRAALPSSRIWET
jgi:multifunctional 2-oxoglutarate metabolism enzyme